MSSKMLLLPNPYGCSCKSNTNKITEWIIIIISMIILIIFQSDLINVHKQCIPGQDADCGDYATIIDPGISYPTKSSTVPFVTINIVCPIIWLILFIINIFIINYYHSIFNKQSKLYKIILIKFEILLRSITVSIIFTSVTTDIIKTFVGRPRPNYVSNDDKEGDAIRSFPSGHASYIFSIFFILTLYLFHSLLNAREIIYFNQINNYKNIKLRRNKSFQHKKRIKLDKNTENAPLSNNESDESHDDDDKHNDDEYENMNNERKVILLMNEDVFHQIKIDAILNVLNGDSYFFVSIFIYLRNFHLLCVLFALSPTIFAVYVGCSRLTDYKHHYSDVLGGALIGIAYSFLSFIYYKSEYFYGFQYDFNKIFETTKHDDGININEHDKNIQLMDSDK